jgi:putative transposase
MPPPERKRKPYPTDLSDTEWTMLEPLVPAVKAGGRPARWERRAIANAICSVVRSGCTGRQLPQDVPPWQTVFYSFRTWRRDGTLEAVPTRLRERLRRTLGRATTPSAASSARQSVKTTARGGPPRKPPPSGDAGGNKVQGRKRHLLGDTQGLVLAALVPAAEVADRDGGPLLREAVPHRRARFPRRRHRWVEVGYQGRFVDWVQASLGWRVQVVQHGWTGVSTVWVLPGQEPPETPTGFQLLKWRWSVARTCAWIGCSRRMSTEYA